MKIFLTLFAVGAFASVCYGQLEEVLVPCALERGVTPEQLHNIKQGDLSSVSDLYGCFIDCASKKMGMITDDTFHPEVFEKHVGNLMKADRVKEIMDKCVPEVGTGECNIAKGVYKCFMTFNFATFFAAP